MPVGVPQLVVWPLSGNSVDQEDFQKELHNYWHLQGEAKPHLPTGLSWDSWCQERGRDPIRGPIADVLNFLAELFEQGYQYRSLNSYQSAISSVHQKVDGVEVGKHPLITRGF